MSEESLTQEELDALLEGADVINNDEDAPMKQAEIEVAHVPEPVQHKEMSAKSSNKPESASDQQQKNIQLLLDIYMGVTVELGRTDRKIKDILGLGEGSIIELDKPAGEPVELLVNNRLVAKGEVVVIDENFGVRITEIIDPKDRLMNMTG